MNNSNYRFTLDMQSIQSQISIPIAFGDTARTLFINLTDGGSPYIIEDGCLAVFSAKRADNESLLHNCVILNNSVIKYDFNSSTAAAEGLVRCEIVLYGPDNNIIASPKFSLVVDERVVYDEIEETSSDRWSSIDAMYSDVQSKMPAKPFSTSDYGKNVAVGADGGLVAVDSNGEQTPTGGTTTPPSGDGGAGQTDVPVVFASGSGGDAQVSYLLTEVSEGVCKARVVYDMSFAYCNAYSGIRLVCGNFPDLATEYYGGARTVTECIPYMAYDYKNGEYVTRAIRPSVGIVAATNQWGEEIYTGEITVGWNPDDYEMQLYNYSFDFCIDIEVRTSGTQMIIIKVSPAQISG